MRPPAEAEQAAGAGMTTDLAIVAEWRENGPVARGTDSASTRVHRLAPARSRLDLSRLADGGTATPRSSQVYE